MRKLAAIALLPLALAAFAPQRPGPELKRAGAEAVSAIARQLIDKQCWTDHSDMPEARRLSAIFRISLGADGHFTKEPELVHPAAPPLGDAPLQAFIRDARRALTQCNALGFDLSPEDAELLQGEDIDIQFVPKIGYP